jgi:acyl-CoA hydrolase/GNAT superfamily N-acetyltransferase
MPPDPDWRDRYADLLRTPEAAMALVRPGQRVFVATGAAEPRALVRALARRRAELVDTELIILQTGATSPLLVEQLGPPARVRVLGRAEGLDAPGPHALAEHTPLALSMVPRRFRSGELPLDVALLSVTPPDVEGRCSLGPSVGLGRAAADSARLVIAQVNPSLPRSAGAGTLWVHDLDLLVPGDEPLPGEAPPPPTPVEAGIAAHVAGLVPDGATLALGEGPLPQAVLPLLARHRDLSIHTATVTDAILDLVQAGVVTGAEKPGDHRPVVATRAWGTPRLYAALATDPRVFLMPVEHVYDPAVLLRQPRLVAIHGATEVDLTGQVVADDGGDAELLRAAARAPGGRSVVALPALSADGQASRLVARLRPGAAVLGPRSDTHFVVTEHGVAYLAGRSLQDRALALISIAAPEHREALLREALALGLVHPELSDLQGKIHLGPDDLRATHVLEDGTAVLLRPVHPTDEAGLTRLFHGLSAVSIYNRWMSHLKRPPRKEILEYVFFDHRERVALAVTLPEAHGEDIIAVGGYYLDVRTNRAEVAFTVRDDWQRRGLGAFLLRHLIHLSRRNGLSGLVAEVLRENHAMLGVFRNCGCAVRSHLEGGVYLIELDFD